MLKAHVKDGKIIRIETDGGEQPQLRACARGRAYRQRVYAPDRLLYPLRRVGARGEGRFERISWDEALDVVASNLLKIKDTYGNAAILLLAHSGSKGFIHGKGPVKRLLERFGGYTSTWGIASCEGTLFASLATYGTIFTGNSEDDLLNSRMIIMWGYNPSEAQHGPLNFYLAQARERGLELSPSTRATLIRPPLSPSSGSPSVRVPTRRCFVLWPMSLSLKNFTIKAFVEKYTTGFDEFKAYILGAEDNVSKTPQWAEAISTVPAETIAGLARAYATQKPAALILGLAPARSALGEQCARAANVLTAITGNIGISGGYACGQMFYGPKGRRGNKSAESSNPVDCGKPHIKNALYKLEQAPVPCIAQIHDNKMFDAMLRGRTGGYPTDIKMAYVVASDVLNQRNNIPKAVEAFKSLDFVVVHEQFMTPTAKFADIVLPVNTFLERSDLVASPLARFYLPAVIKSLGQSKTDLEICQELSQKLGIPDAFEDNTEKNMMNETAAARGIDLHQVQREGIARNPRSKPVVAFQEQIENPDQNPFPTPSGKIEIYCRHLAEMNDPLVPPVPKYITHWENYDDPLTVKYPLQLITPHSTLRAHSTYDNIPWLRELEPHTVWISPIDASARGINDGDTVEVFNDRGRVRIQARVTPRILPGVVSIYQGVWYDPDENGVDRRGSANVLTKDEQSPGGAFPFNTALVQVSASPGKEGKRP